jgi:hypothetical protein
VAGFPPPGTLTLTWRYSQISTDIVFKVYSTTNLGTPISKWPVYTNLTSRSCVIPVLPGNRFFAVSASNITTRVESPFGQCPLVLRPTPAVASNLPPQPRTITLTWNYPQMSPDIVFKIYSSTNLGTPVSKWPVYTNLTSTSCVIPVLPGNRFFAVTASNMATRTESAFGR